MEDLKKSVLIKGDNIIGFTGRGVIPMTQEEFNALPPEKQLNGSYYITDGTDEIVISDNEVSEKQLWSSQKIASELKTNSNTAVVPTPDLVDTTYFDYGGNRTVSNYMVRNGICYFSLLLLEKAHTTSFVTIMEGLPKALMQTYFSFAPYYSASDDNTSLQVNISSDGIMAVSMGAKDNTYMLNGSYPIA